MPYSEKAMRCVICKQGRTQPGVTTVTLERDGLVLVVREVPAQVCTNCNEAYLDENTTKHVLNTAEQMIRCGTQVDVRRYVPA